MKNKTKEIIMKRNGAKYKLVPPEGGWGFMICLSVALQFTALFSSQACFGIIYSDFLASVSEGTSGITLVHGVHAIVFSIAAFISNALLKRLSLRQVALLGSVVFCVGAFLGIFVRSIIHLLITNGIIQASGIGLAFCTSYTAFNSYFTKKRLLFMSLIKLTVGLASVSTPLLVRYCIDEFGFRGTLVMIFGLALHSILASLLMQPVEWHMKMEEISQDEVSLFNCEINADIIKITNENDETFTIKKNITDDCKLSATQENKEIKTKLKKHNDTENFGEAKILLANTISEVELEILKNKESLPAEERRFSHDISLLDEKLMRNLMKASSIMSLSNIPVEPLSTVLEFRERLKLVVDYFDLSLLKDLIYTNIIIGMAVTSFTDSIFNALLPLYLYKIDWNTGLVAKAISLVAAGDMVGRFLLILVSKLIHDHSRYLYLTGMVVTVFLRFAFVMVSETVPCLVLLGLIGLVRCLVHVTTPLVLADHVPLDRYPAAFSLFMLFFGIINLLGGPVIGLIRDITGSYLIVFNILTLLVVAVAVPWLIEIYIQRQKIFNLVLAE